MSVGTTEKMEPTLDRTPEAELDFARQGTFQEGDNRTGRPKHSYAASWVRPGALAALRMADRERQPGTCKQGIST